VATLELGGGEVGTNVNIQQSGVFFGNDKVVDSHFMNSICSLSGTDCQEKITKTIKSFKKKINDRLKDLDSLVEKCIEENKT